MPKKSSKVSKENHDRSRLKRKLGMANKATRKSQRAGDQASAQANLSKAAKLEEMYLNGRLPPGNRPDSGKPIL